MANRFLMYTEASEWVRVHMDALLELHLSCHAWRTRVARAERQA